MSEIKAYIKTEYTKLVSNHVLIEKKNEILYYNLKEIDLEDLMVEFTSNYINQGNFNDHIIKAEVNEFLTSKGLIQK